MPPTCPITHSHYKEVGSGIWKNEVYVKKSYLSFSSRLKEGGSPREGLKVVMAARRSLVFSFLNNAHSHLLL